MQIRCRLRLVYIGKDNKTTFVFVGLGWVVEYSNAHTQRENYGLVCGLRLRLFFFRITSWWPVHPHGSRLRRLLIWGGLCRGGLVSCSLKNSKGGIYVNIIYFWKYLIILQLKYKYKYSKLLFNLLSVSLCTIVNQKISSTITYY
jgi:hypothetical protein